MFLKNNSFCSFKNGLNKYKNKSRLQNVAQLSTIQNVLFHLGLWIEENNAMHIYEP